MDLNDGADKGEKMGSGVFSVTVPAGNGYSDPAGIPRIVEHFQQLGIDAEFATESGVATKTPEGAYTLTVKGNERAKGLAAQILRRHYGLDVEEKGDA